MPTTLSAAERVLWTALAPRAHAMGTLRDATVPGFVLLCEAVTALEEARAIIKADGLVVGGKAHPLLTHVRQLTQRVESLLGRYQLAATGRPVDVAPAPAHENQWAALERDAPAKTFEFFPTARGR